MLAAQQKRIFVVEDEALIAMDLCERLSALGYSICGKASRGETAIPRILDTRPDLVLMDVNLAGKLDGVEVACLVREQYDVPVVMLTAFSDPELIARASRAGSFGYLVKPYRERELHATLQIALARHDCDRELREQATIDPLTGLYNRRFLKEMLPVEISRANREQRVLSVAMLDIDHFKRLNDTYGHAAGDHALRRVATAIRGALRATDIVCRYGGEEFAIIMPGTDVALAAARLTAICGEIRGLTIEDNGFSMSVTVWAGVAECPLASSDPELLMRAADAALYRAKNAGRDRVAIADLVAGGNRSIMIAPSAQSPALAVQTE